MMRDWRNRAAAAAVLAVIVTHFPAPLSAAPACDQDDPRGPMQSARITLDSSDFVDQRGDEMRSFIDTGSLGRVDVSVVASAPPGVVVGLSAVPSVSRASHHYGEELKGIAVAVSLGASRRPARVTLNLRQVCAQRFRNTFLYY